jgi:hypothetical protein
MGSIKIISEEILIFEESLEKCYILKFEKKK